MKEFDEIDRLFQTTFDGFESTPDPSIKENIDRAIASKKKRRGFFFLFLSLFIGTIVLGAIVYSYSSVNKTSIAENNRSSSSNHHPVQIKKEAKQSTTVDRLTNNTDQKSESEQAIDYIYTQQPTEAINYITKKEKKNSIISNDSETLPLTDQRAAKSMNEWQLIAQENDSLSEIVYRTNSKEVDTTLNSDIVQTDSLDKNAPEIIKETDELGLIKQPAHKWYLTTFTGWEGEKKSPFEKVESNDLSSAGKESAHIHSSSFYGKVEINRKLATRFDILVGIGFKSSKLTQYSSQYLLDSALVVDELTSAIPDSFAYFVRNETGKQIFRVNSILLPIGVAYSLPIGKNFHFRLSAGTELAYGWRTNVLLQPNVSEPRFRSFGWNIWMRPEIHYSFGKIRLIGFGSINHALFQQMKWDVATHRNPSFGGGIGLQFHF